MTTTPLALRLNSQRISAQILSATTTTLDLGTRLVAGTRWFFALVTSDATEITTLTQSAGAPVVLQLLHPDLNRWTTPVQVTYQLTTTPYGSLTLPGLLGRYLPAEAGTNPGISPYSNTQITLDVTLTAPGYFDAPKFYAPFYG